MKKFEGTYFEVVAADRSHKLADSFNSFEEAVRARADSIKRQEACGYVPTRFIIMRTIWSRMFDDNGDFYSETQDTVRMTEEGIAN